MHITVAICTWNRAHLLCKTLANLKNVTANVTFPWDLLVIDNNCTDNTPKIVKDFVGQLPITYVVEARPGLSNARNCALDKFKGSHILFTDDDVLVSDNWLSTFWRGILAYPNAGAFGGPIYPWFEELPDPLLIQAFPHLASGFCGILENLPEGLLPVDRDLYGANMGFKKSSIENLRFDPKLGASRIIGREGEEIDFLARLRERGEDIIWLPLMTVKHYIDPHRMTLSYLCAYYEGRAQTTVRRNGVADGKIIYGMPRWLVRQWIVSGLLALLYRITGNTPLYLKELKKFYENSGMLKESKKIYREQHQMP